MVSLSCASVLVNVWISIDDATPPDDKCVLAYGRGFARPTICFRVEGFWYDYEHETEIEPTHWMALPEPPAQLQDAPKKVHSEGASSTLSVPVVASAPVAAGDRVF